MFAERFFSFRLARRRMSSILCADAKKPIARMISCPLCDRSGRSLRKSAQSQRPWPPIDQLVDPLFVIIEEREVRLASL